MTAAGSSVQRARRYAKTVLAAGVLIIVVQFKIGFLPSAFAFAAAAALGGPRRSSSAIRAGASRSDADDVADVAAVHLPRTRSGWAGPSTASAPTPRRVVRNTWRSELLWFETTEEEASVAGAVRGRRGSTGGRRPPTPPPTSSGARNRRVAAATARRAGPRRSRRCPRPPGPPWCTRDPSTTVVHGTGGPGDPGRPPGPRPAPRRSDPRGHPDRESSVPGVPRLRMAAWRRSCSVLDGGRRVGTRLHHCRPWWEDDAQWRDRRTLSAVPDNDADRPRPVGPRRGHGGGPRQRHGAVRRAQPRTP